MKTIKKGDTNLVLLTNGETLFSQGEDGDKAFMIVSGSLEVLVDGKRVGWMRDGEVFGELALLLNQKRSATIISNRPTELIEINKQSFDVLINSASPETKKIIIELCKELSKRAEFQTTPFTEKELNAKLENENEIISKFTKQIYFRLDQSTSHIE